MALTPKDARAFILANTGLLSPPHVPEITLHLATEAHDLWLKTEEELESIGLPPPYWAFAWAGGQGLARYLLDNPHLVRGKTVLDFASGSGLVGIAAAKAGASQVTCADIDPFCAEAIALNAKANRLDYSTSTSVPSNTDPALSIVIDDLIGRDFGWDVLFAGDVFYDSAFASRLLPWLRNLASRSILVLVGDPGRSYLPRADLTSCAVYEVPVSRALEDAEVKRTTVWRMF